MRAHTYTWTSGFQPYLCGNTHLENKKQATYLSNKTKKKQMANDMYKQLKSKVWNYLATHQKETRDTQMIENH